MSTIHWVDPDDSESGGYIADSMGAIYCKWGIDTLKLRLTVEVQGRAITKSLLAYEIDEMTEVDRKNLYERLAKGVADNFYSIAQLHDDLGHIPDEGEVKRLIAEYPSFRKKPYRVAFLHQLLAGERHAEMASSKLEYDGDDPTSKGPKGKAVVWTKKKAKKMALRLLYLKFVDDDDLARGEAVDRLMIDYPHLTNATSRSNVFKATQRPCDK